MKDSIQRGNPERQGHWQEVVRRWKESGQSVREYCRVQGLRESAFYFWRRALARRGQDLGAAEAAQAKASERDPTPQSGEGRGLPHRNGPAFLPVQVVEAVQVEAVRGVEIVLPQGRTVRVAAGFDRQTLSDVLAVLEARPC